MVFSSCVILLLILQVRLGAASDGYNFLCLMNIEHVQNVCARLACLGEGVICGTLVASHVRLVHSQAASWVRDVSKQGCRYSTAVTTLWLVFIAWSAAGSNRGNTQYAKYGDVVA